MARKKAEIPENETGQEKFRRVIAPRIKKALKVIDQIGTMPTQTRYDIDESDAKHVMAVVDKAATKLMSNYEKAIAGTLKAKEIKEYTGIDWDAELEQEEKVED